MRYAIVGAACLSLAGCGTGVTFADTPEPYTGQVTLPTDLSQVDRYLARSLKDPDSIKQYRISQAVHCKGTDGSNESCMCVEYNAKNSYGAYGGVTLSRAHWMPDGSKLLILLPVDNERGVRIEHACDSAVFEDRDPSAVRTKPE